MVKSTRWVVRLRCNVMCLKKQKVALWKIVQYLYALRLHRQRTLDEHEGQTYDFAAQGVHVQML